MLRLGYFSEFKGNDTVLLSVGAGDLDALCVLLKKFALSPHERTLALHRIAWVSQTNPVVISLEKDVEAWTEPFESGVFALAFTFPDEILSIEERLRALVGVTQGHLYADLSPRGQFMVSKGEYPDAWWEQYA